MTDSNFVSALKVEFEKLGGGKTALAEVNALKSRVAALEGARPNATVVQTWRSGASWYRKWSDGFIEQGGLHSYTNTNWNTVNLNTAFSSASYTIAVSTMKTSTSATGSYQGYSVCGRSITTFKARTSDSSNVAGMLWYACGY